MSVAAAGPTRMQRIMIRSIESYQRAFEGRPSPCRFFPTCSSYAHEAIVVHGSLRGGWLTIRRLSRCRPLGPSGFDPVPEPAHESSCLESPCLEHSGLEHSSKDA